MKKRVLIADDHTLVAEGIRRLLEPEYEVVGVAEDGRAALRSATQLNPDIVLLDIAMPGMNGVEAALRFREELPHTKLVFLTQQSSQHFARAAFRAGADGFVIKQSAASELLTALDKVVRGRRYISPRIAMGLPSPDEMRSEEEGVFAGGMTARQREVLQLVAEGKTIKEVASVLHISAKTVEFHKRGIMEALGLRTTAELTKYAIEQGIIR